MSGSAFIPRASGSRSCQPSPGGGHSWRPRGISHQVGLAWHLAESYRMQVLKQG